MKTEAAIKSKINFSKANTSVSYDVDTDESNVYLHGNNIATVGSNFLHIFDGGWQSVTTKSRLNALINEFCDAFTKYSIDWKTNFWKEMTACLST